MSQGLQVFFRDEVQELIDALAHTFRVRITLFSPDMQELTVGLQNPGSNFCKLIQGPMKRLHECQLMDRQMCHRAERLNTMTHYRCHAGLLEAVLPIRSSWGIIGFLMVGQFRDTEAPPEAMGRPLAEAFLATPLIDPVSRDKMLTLAQMLVQLLVSQQFMGLKQGAVMESLSDYIDQNLGGEITIEAAAAALGKGTSTLAHAVKKATGKSFTHFVQRRRVEGFESLVRSRRDLQTGQAALQVGFVDPLYFSRVYRKIRGTSARQFRAGL